MCVVTRDKATLKYVGRELRRSHHLQIGDVVNYRQYHVLSYDLMIKLKLEELEDSRSRFQMSVRHKILRSLKRKYEDIENWHQLLEKFLLKLFFLIPPISLKIIHEKTFLLTSFYETCWKNGIMLSQKIYMTHSIFFTFIDPIIDLVYAKNVSVKGLKVSRRRRDYCRAIWMS